MIIASRRRMGIYIVASMHIFFLYSLTNIENGCACLCKNGWWTKKARERDRGEEKESDQCAGCQW